MPTRKLAAILLPTGLLLLVILGGYYLFSSRKNSCIATIDSGSKVLKVVVDDDAKFKKFITDYAGCTDGKFVVGDSYDPELAPHEFGG